MHSDTFCIFRPEINEFIRVYKMWNFLSSINKQPKLVVYYTVLTSKQLPVNAEVTVTSQKA
jgi:hypothetical protein